MKLIDILTMKKGHMFLLKFTHKLWVIILAIWTFQKQMLKCERFIRGEIYEQQWERNGRRLES